MTSQLNIKKLDDLKMFSEIILKLLNSDIRREIAVFVFRIL